MGVAHNPSVIHAILTGEPYPVKSMILWGANPVLTYPDTRKVIEALKRLEFIVVMAYTPSPTTEYADLILPASHPFEQNGITFSRYANCLSSMPKLVEPPERCFDIVEILHSISKRMEDDGYIDHNLIPWKNMVDFIGWRLRDMEHSFMDLCENGPMIVEPKYKKYEKRGFRTPSKKVELYSTIMKRFGYDPLPVYREPEESPIHLYKLAEAYPLYLVSRRSRDKTLPCQKPSALISFPIILYMFLFMRSSMICSGRHRSDTPVLSRNRPPHLIRTRLARSNNPETILSQGDHIK
jgi:anaerobic selenocysteine-containing dehydrogenase